MSSRSSVDRAPTRCSGGHGFDSFWGLRIFLCPTLVSCWLIHLHNVSNTMINLFISVICYCVLNTYGLLTKCEVKMAGYWPSSFFREFMDQDGVEAHKLAKKEWGQYPAILTEQAWSIKDLLYGFRGNFSCGTRRVVPSGQDSSILPAQVANHSAGFDSSCPLTELAI